MHDTAARKVIMGQGRDRPLGASHLDARDANDELAADSRCGDMQGAAWSSWARTSYSHLHLGGSVRRRVVDREAEDMRLRKQ